MYVKKFLTYTITMRINIHETNKGNEEHAEK